MYVAFKISLAAFMAVGVKIIGYKGMHSTTEEPRILRIENGGIASVLEFGSQIVRRRISEDSNRRA
jgi:hypothetical protein